MTTDRRLEQLLGDLLVDGAPARAPEALRPQVISTTSRARPRSRWLVDIKERPMRLHNAVAVGSPTRRLAYTLIITLLLVLLATGAVAGGARLFAVAPPIVVAADGSGTVRTITEGVAMATDGDTVLVKPGTYTDSVTITRDITLRGDGDRGSVVVEASGAILPTGFYDGESASFVFLLDDTTATVANLTVRGGPPIVAIVTRAGAPTIEDVTVELAEKTGVRHMSLHVEGGSATVRRSILPSYVWMGEEHDSQVGGPYPLTVTIEGNDFPGATGFDIEGGTVTVVMRDNSFRDAPPFTAACCGSLPGGLGIGVVSGLIEHNEFTNYPVRFAGPGNPTFRDNMIRDTITGITVEEGGRPVIEDNEVTANAVGIQVTDGDPVLRDNRVRDNSSAGVVIVRGSSTVEGNTIEANEVGFRVGRNATPIVVGNTICDNVTNLDVLDGSTVNVEGNTICEDPASPSP